ncbi:MAG: hypothetical protein HQM09_23760 [Candidatus Riflebacteria bacterium]|nr:hypothetical protein [Candidatus Riflebacteria bacterium]
MKKDIREAKLEWCPSAAIAFQQEANRIIHTSVGCYLGRTVHVREWFEVTNFFVSLIRRANRSSTAGLKHLLEHMGVPLSPEMQTIASAGIEMLRVHERQKLFVATVCFLTADRARLETELMKSGITRQGLCGKDEPVPALVAEFASTLPDKPVTRKRRPKQRLAHPRPRHEVMRMMARLERRLEMMQR